MSIIPPIPPELTGTPNLTTRIWLDDLQSYTVSAGDVIYAQTTDGATVLGSYNAQSFAFVNNGEIWSHGSGILGGTYFGTVTNNGVMVANAKAPRWRPSPSTP
jgi:hypothetical protein